MVMSLVEQAHDEDLGVRETVTEALIETGRYEASLVLSSCGNFMVGNAKVRHLANAFDFSDRFLPDAQNASRSVVACDA